MKRKYIITLLVLVSGFAVWYFFFNKKEEIQWLTDRAEKGDIMIGVTATGTINAVTTVDVGTQVSGVISKLYADYNSVVKKGQIIAVLDTTSLAMSVQEAQSNYYKAEARYRQAKQVYDRNKMLLEKKVIAQVEYDQAYTDLQTASGDLSTARSQVSKSKINLKFAKIVSPIDGIVISKSVNVGQTVAASFNTPTLFTIANDLSRMEVIASVDEADIGQVKEGQKVLFTVDAYNEEVYEGKVKQIRLQPTILQNVVTYTVVVDASNPEKKLMPGMTANITIIMNEKKGVVKIPVSAMNFVPPQDLREQFRKHLPDSIKAKFGAEAKEKGQGGKSGKRMNRAINKGDKKRIWIKNGETVYPVQVETGLTDGTMVEVTGKIKEGDEVLLGVVQKPKEGQAQQQQQNPFTPQRQRRR